MEYRYTNLKKYSLCPYRCFREAFMDDEEDTAAKATGSLVHKALEFVLTGQEHDYFIAAQKARVALKEEIKDVEKDILQKDVNILLCNARKFMGNVTGPGLQIERKIVVPVNPADPASPIFQSTIDIIDSLRHKIVDWKTGYLKADPLQLKVYAYMCKRVGIEIQEATFVYLRDKAFKTIKITPEALKEAEDYVTKTVSEIEDKTADIVMGDNPEVVFAKTKNVHCKTCEFIMECLEGRMEASEQSNEQPQAAPENPGVTETVDNEKTPGETAQKTKVKAEVKTQDEARDLGLEILQLEALVDRYKDILKEYVKSNGEVICDTKKFAFVPSSSWSPLNANSLKDMAMKLVDEGRNPWELMTFGSKNIKKIEWTEDKLKAFCKLTSKNNFKCVSIDDSAGNGNEE